MFRVIYCGVFHRGHGNPLDWSFTYGGCGGSIEHPNAVLVRTPDGDYMFHTECAPPRVAMFSRGLEAERAARRAAMEEGMIA